MPSVYLDLEDFRDLSKIENFHGFLDLYPNHLIILEEIPDTLFETWHKTGERILKF
jgi:hypothetical protein